MSLAGERAANPVNCGTPDGCLPSQHTEQLLSAPSLLIDAPMSFCSTHNRVHFCADVQRRQLRIFIFFFGKSLKKQKSPLYFGQNIIGSNTLRFLCFYLTGSSPLPTFTAKCTFKSLCLCLFLCALKLKLYLLWLSQQKQQQQCYAAIFFYCCQNQDMQMWNLPDDVPKSGRWTSENMWKVCRYCQRDHLRPQSHVTPPRR